jgi:hypothetical protein
VSAVLGQSRFALVKNLIGLMLLRNTLSASILFLRFVSCCRCVCHIKAQLRDSEECRYSVDRPELPILSKPLCFDHAENKPTTASALLVSLTPGVRSACEVFWKRKLGDTPLQYWFNAGIIAFWRGRFYFVSH